MSENKHSFGHGFCSWNILTFIMQENVSAVHTSSQIPGLNVVSSYFSLFRQAPKVVALYVASASTTQHTQCRYRGRPKKQ
jgi:hypothetical protein